MTKIAKDWTAWPRESLGMLHSYGLEICLIKALPSFRIDKMMPHHYRTKTTTVPYSTVHSEKQLGSSLSSRVSAPPSALLVFWEDQNPLLVPICIWISLQEWEPRGRSREWLDCYKKRWLISYRIAFSLAHNHSQVGWLALLFLSVFHPWQYWNWCFSCVTVSAKESYVFHFFRSSLVLTSFCLLHLS